MTGISRVVTAGIVLLFIAESAGHMITRRVTVQPIRVNSATEQANPAGMIYTEETAKIMAQAGVEVLFLPLKNITNATFLHASSDITKPNSLFALAQSPGNGANANPSVINLWFVKSIDNNAGAIGFAQQTSVPFGTQRPKNGILIADAAFSYAGGKGMRDIFAHELGHNLGLYHGANESGVVLTAGEQGLMSRTSTYPTSIDALYPDGAMLGQLNVAEIQRIQAVTTFVKVLPAEEQYEYPKKSSGELQIEQQPASMTVHPGEELSLSILATGAFPLSYTWYKDEVILTNEIETSLRIPNASEAATGSYFAVVTSTSGAVTSSIANVTIVPLRLSAHLTAEAKMQLHWEGLAGRVYSVEARATVEEEWNRVIELPVLTEAGARSWQDSSTSAGSLFFRVTAAR